MAIYRGVGGSGDSSTGEDVFGDNSSITSLNGLSGAIQTPTYIKFAADANHTASQGELTWNTDEGTLDLGLNHGGVVLQIGQELHYRVTNQSGTDIPDGTLVAFVGTTGNSGKLLVDVYDGSQASKAILGLTTETILNGANGYVTSFGKVRGIQTNGVNYSETWVDGDILYPSPTGLTKVLPQAPAAKQPVAVVVHSHGSNGELFVRVQSGTTLAEDELVQLTSLSNGDILQYNSTSGRFENVDASVVAGSISDGDRGDITVSASGATWTIDNSVVSSIKLGGDVTTAGKTLLTAADADAQKTALGLVIGTNVQAYSANLDEYAAVNPTTAGLALLDDVDNAAQRTSLGLGALATQGDGDKGDITVSGSGATWTIDNDTVTFAKMQNINTERLLGRTTASSGDVEELSVGSGLSLSGGVLSNTINPLTQSAAKSATGTSIDFTAIPAWVKKITVVANAISTNGTSNVLIQIGDSGGLAITGYLGAMNAVGISLNNSPTNGFGFGQMSAATNIFYGIVTLVNISGNTWVSSGVTSRSDTQVTTVTAGSKTLSDTLDRLSIVTSNGTDSFDSGSISILYE